MSIFVLFAEDVFESVPHTHDDLHFSAASDEIINEDINTLFMEHKERYAPTHCRGYRPDQNAEIVERVSTKQMKNVFVRESYTHVIFGVALSLIEGLAIGALAYFYAKYDADKKIKEMELPRYVQNYTNEELTCVFVQ